MTITISRHSVLASGAAAAIASGASVARASAATTSTTASPLRIGVTQRLLTAAEHSAFPGSALLSDGRLALTWRQGDAHAGGSDGRLMWSTSSTKGATWERPTVLLDDPDSRDAGLTWPSRQVLDVPGQLATYAAPVEVSPGVVCCPFGSQDSGTEASLMVRYLGMPGTVTPFREVIGS
jgi:hypothetical protein